MVYRPQANGTEKRMMQTLTRDTKMYVEDVDQIDWDEYAKKMTFTLNTAQYCVRGDNPFYLIHSWDPRSTFVATLPLGSSKIRASDREDGYITFNGSNSEQERS